MYHLTDKHRKQLRENVLRGCTLLDRRRPRWYTQINLDALDLSSGERCICGQLEAFSRGLNYDDINWTQGFTRLLGLSGTHQWSTARAERYGFSLGRKWAANRSEAWLYAENVWRREIKTRRNAAAKQKAAA